MTGASGIFRKILSVAVLCFFATAVHASSQDTKGQEDRKARLEQEIAILDGQIQANAARQSNALSNLTLIRKKIASRKALIAESDNQIATLSDEMARKERAFRSAQAHLDTLSDYYTRLVRNSYKNRDTKIWYMYILASDNVSQAFRRFGYLRDLSKQLNVQAAKIKEAQAVLEKEKAELAALRETARQARSQRVSEMTQLQREENDSRQIVNQLGRDRRKYQQELDKKRREIEALTREIERIIREAMAEKPASGKTERQTAQSAKRPPIDYKLAGQFEANKGKLPWPAEGPVVDHFGQHYHPVFTRVKLPFNNGVSVALKPGTSVEAVFDGVVKQIVVIPGYNKCILVQHGSYFTFYCKLGNVNVKTGNTVKTGQKIGTVDTINGDTQLHFQIWKGRTPQDPETWLRP